MALKSFQPPREQTQGGSLPLVALGLQSERTQAQCKAWPGTTTIIIFNVIFGIFIDSVTTITIILFIIDLRLNFVRPV